MYADVILPLKLAGALTYSVPEGMTIYAGSRVTVPVGENKTYLGIVVRTHNEAPQGNFTIKPITSVCDNNATPVATGHMLRLWQWIADYYLCTVGDVMRAALPAKLKRTSRRKITKALEWDAVENLPTLTESQQKALDAIGSNPIVMLHGVTASGKTAIYEHLINNTDGQVLYLVPEIALTTQLEERLRNVFGNRIAVFHSKMTDAQRAEVWERQLSDNPYPIILGARSSVFLPFRNLKLVIVDEEHEASYKQQEPAPRYHARNVAIMMARHLGAQTVLGSATPSVECYYHARRGHYCLVELNERFVANNAQTNIVIADVAELRRKKLMKSILSPQLKEAMTDAMSRGEQTILFQNRRGWAPLIECKQCGWVPRCTRCDVSLTMHRRQNVMVCHTCGNTYSMPLRCPLCGATELRSRGVGTEKVEKEVRSLFPEARVSRLDLDSAKTQGDVASIMYDFERQCTDVLIGTQMVTKGLDFSNVSVVGIISADNALNVPDFRAYERAYELMAQVAGRAGRRGNKATVVIQTRQPDTSVIQHVVGSNYLAHYKEVMQERLDFCYPPFCRLIDIYIKHRYEDVAMRAAQAFVSRIVNSRIEGVEVLGPDAPATSRISNMYIQKAMVKIRPEANLSAIKALLWSLHWQFSTESTWKQPLVIFDVDPMN